MALIARMPLAIAPAMGVNAYFSYTVVGFMGTGKISYQVFFNLIPLHTLSGLDQARERSNIRIIIVDEWSNRCMFSSSSRMHLLPHLWKDGSSYSSPSWGSVAKSWPSFHTGGGHEISHRNHSLPYTLKHQLRSALIS